MNTKNSTGSNSNDNNTVYGSGRSSEGSEEERDILTQTIECTVHNYNT